MIPVLGFDPGANGCVASTSNGKDVEVIRFAGRSIFEMRHELNDLPLLVPNRLAYGEKTGFRPSDVKTDKIFGIVKMERNAGKIQGALELMAFRINWVTHWHYEFGLGGIADYEARKKAAHKFCQELMGSWVTKDIADGILVSIFGWRKENGELTHGKKTDFTARPGTGVLYTRRSGG